VHAQLAAGAVAWRDLPWGRGRAPTARQAAAQRGHRLQAAWYVLRAGRSERVARSSCRLALSVTTALVPLPSADSTQPLHPSPTCTRYWKPFRAAPPPLTGTVPKVGGAAASSSGVASAGRMAAWGQMKEQMLH
jgi:hypothetical protein